MARVVKESWPHEDPVCRWGEAGQAVPLLAGNQRWYKYDLARIAWVDPSTGRVELRAEHTTPEELCEATQTRADLVQVQQRAGRSPVRLHRDEVLIYALPSFERLSYFSLPAFHDLHHIRATPGRHHRRRQHRAGHGDGVDHRRSDGARWSAKEGEDPWLRYSKDKDYRRVRETGQLLPH